MKLRILADDLTGALDSAAAFEAEVPVAFDTPTELTGPLGQVRISAVATASRDIATAALPAELQGALPWLCEATLAFKKVDSLLRGNTFAEVAWLARAGGFGRVVFAPAFPAQGRLCCGGRLHLRQGNGSLQAQPGPGMHEALRQALGAGPPVALSVPDIDSDAELQALASIAGGDAAGGAAEAAAPRTLWCGSAGLAQALARHVGCAATGTGRLVTAPGPRLLVSASRHAVLQRQWPRLRQAFAQGPCFQGLDEQVLDALTRHLAGGRGPAFVNLAPREALGAAQAAALLAAQAHQLAQALPHPGTLVVVGGDTLRALCSASGASALVSLPGGRPGWGQARWHGGPWHDALCHSRSGAFGDDDDLVRQLRALEP